MIDIVDEEGWPVSGTSEQEFSRNECIDKFESYWKKRGWVFRIFN